uniref:Uncharacterized protein n=1 Tax=Ananas comosus var. bracteatus TaxID=296719 RepID=A0A6V7PG76_ANACO|nr:unnamed protein product [Ananas comosus var. bracteatus]
MSSSSSSDRLLRLLLVARRLLRRPPLGPHLLLLLPFALRAAPPRQSQLSPASALLRAPLRQAPPPPRPPKPRLALRDLIFTLDVYRCSGGDGDGDGESLLSLAKPGDELALKSGGIFLFEVALTAGGNAAAAVNCREEMKVVWTAVKVGCACDVGGDVGAFSMMECAGKGRAVGGSGLWFAEKLPARRAAARSRRRSAGRRRRWGWGWGWGWGE